MNQRTCNTCGNTFLPTHGRQAYCTEKCKPKGRPKYLAECEVCGGPVLKEIRKQRYGGIYCSNLCHDYKRWGGQSCKIPRDHISRWLGQSCPWSPPSPPFAPHPTECHWCGIEMVATCDTKAFCSLPCRTAAKKQRRRAREHNALGEFTYSEVMRQYARQGYLCAYCGTKPDSLPDPEHVQPLSRGGRNDMSNIVAACRRCNGDKRDLTLIEWAADRERRRLPSINTDLTGFTYSSLSL